MHRTDERPRARAALLAMAHAHTAVQSEDKHGPRAGLLSTIRAAAMMDLAAGSLVDCGVPAPGLH